MHHDLQRTKTVQQRLNSHLSRRAVLGGVAGATAATMLAANQATAADDPNWKITNGRIKQSVVHWCFNPMSVEELATASAKMGLKSVELVDPKHWAMLKKQGLTCAIASSHGFVKGWNHKENWDFCREKLTASIEAAAEFGCPSVITFSGMREGISDEAGLKNCIDGLKTVIGLAEKKKVNLCIEPLNTRVDVEMKGHPGYQCDTIEWGVKVCEGVGSERMKILFDIYHTQIMQGDVIVRLRQFKDYIGHIHTAGVPGRNELDDTQEINYPAVMKAIVDIGYQGFVGQEFIPTWQDKIAALRHAAKLCDV
jgi:hydroxypyruvate isomerase